MIGRDEISKVYLSGIMVYFVMLLVSIGYKWTGGSAGVFWVSIGWMVLIVPVFVLIKKDIFTIPFVVVNAVIAGLTIATFLIHSNVVVMINPMITLGFVLLMILSSIVVRQAKNKRLSGGWLILVSVLLFVGGLWVLLLNIHEQGGWIVFSSILLMCMNISVFYWQKSKREWDTNKVIRHYNMLMFGSLFFVVLALLTEGESLEIATGIPEERRQSREL